MMAANSQPKDPCDDGGSTSTSSVGGSTSTSSDPICPCKVVKKGNPVFIQCEEKSCKNKWWHAMCAGFKNPKRAAINAVGDWMCPICVVGLLPKSPAAKIPGNQAMVAELVKMRNKIDVDLDKMNSQILTLSKSLENFDVNQKKIEENSANLNSAFENISKKPTFSELFTTSSDTSNNFINKLAKDVVNSHNRLSAEREAREKNIMIFNGPDEKPDDPNADTVFFNSLSKDVLGIETPSKVEISRIGEKIDGKTRILKIRFPQTWDKRVFLSKLSNLKSSAEFKNIHVSHDMCMEDRTESKRLLKIAYQKKQR